MLDLPRPHPNWRFYRVVDSNGYAHQIRDQIRNIDQLQKLMRRVGDSDVYHSIAYFCNPSTVSFNDFRGKKAGFQQADNLLINGDLVFDIDARQRSLLSARDDALGCRDWLLQMGYSPVVVFSGRGFHLRVLKHDLGLKAEKPQERIREYRKLRVPLVSEVKSRGVQIDSEVTLNPKGLIRLIGSVNTKTGTTVVTVDSLDRFDVERVPSNITHSPATPKGNDASEERKDQDSQTGPRLPELADTPHTISIHNSTSNRNRE